MCEVDNDGKFAIENEYWFDPKLYPEIFEEIEQPLFTTEDGRDIYIGEEVWFAENEHTFSMKAWKDKVFYDTLDILEDKKCKAFSTKEAAEKYIDENKMKLNITVESKNFDSDKEMADRINKNPCEACILSYSIMCIERKFCRWDTHKEIFVKVKVTELEK